MSAAPRRDTLAALGAALGLTPEHRAALERAARRMPEPVAATARQHNLPVELNSFVGRGQELAEVQMLVRRHRLATLTGAGGCGKTRLALRAAAAVLDAGAHADGAWLVDLAPIADAALIPRAALSALGAREVPGRAALETLVDYLQARTLLLVLDNCEHLVAACAEFAETLLRACPELRVLATSREPLGVPGEAVWRVPSLGLPPPAATEADVVRSEAVCLFAERVRLVQPGFAISVANAAAVAQLCRRLDGIPLALELAAARAGSLTIEQLAARLDDRFRLLTGGARTALRRQQTLRATVDWSYDLLAAEERALLRRLSVFAGGWTLEAAEAVGVGLPNALSLLLQLVDKSLVVAESKDENPASMPEATGGAGFRYRLLETVRQYAQEQLLAADEASTARDLHRDYFLSWAERAAPEVVARDQLLWYARIETEHDNLRAAIEWSAGDGTACELRLCAALAHFWVQRGYLGEGRERLAGALLRGSAEPTRERAVALDWASNMELLRFDRAHARDLCEEAITVARAVGDGRILASALRHIATIDWAGDGSTPAVRDALEAALAAAREADYRREIGFSLSWLGRVVLDLGDDAASLAMEAEGRRLLREVGDRDALSANLAMSAENAMARGDHAAARGLLDEALVVSREMGNVAGETLVLLVLGDLARAEGDLTVARAQYAEALRVCRANGARSFLRPAIRALQRLAGLSLAAGDARRAARIFGAEAAARGDSTMFQGRRDRWQDDLASARASLGEEAFAAAWVEGRAMTLEEAIADALDFDGSWAGPREPAGKRT